MNKNELTKENYFSKEMQLKYCGSSELKSFQECESRAMAKLNGEYNDEKTTSLLIGSYIDSYYEGSLDKFKEENPEIFKKDGILKAEYKKADEIIERLQKDELFSKYMSGEKQVVMTGEIEGLPFKIKIDSYHKDKAIVDLKIVKDFQYIWNDKTREKENFVYYWKYNWQAAIYQEIVRQNTGKQLPFFICAATKETVTDFAVLSIPQDVLDESLEQIKKYIPRIKLLKEGKEIPNKCCKCNYCIQNKKLEKIIDFRKI